MAPLLDSGLHDWIPRGSEVAIIDVPVHSNAGDHFISAVTEWWLRDRDCHVVYRAGVRDCRADAARRAIGRDTIVVGLGGGNFGDLYPRYQALRERVIQAFPSHRIVVLPQSLHFSRREALDRSAVRLRHDDLRIAVRDEASLAVARTFTPHVRLLPDMVDGVGPRMLAAEVADAPATARREGRTLYLLRHDSERAERVERRSDVNGPWVTLDWPHLLPGFHRRLVTAALLMPLAPEHARNRLHAWWLDTARASLVRAVAEVRRYDRVVTDRLHGAIIARLATRPATLIDNTYGKLSAYYDAWWRDDPSVTIGARS